MAGPCLRAGWIFATPARSAVSGKRVVLVYNYHVNKSFDVTHRSCFAKRTQGHARGTHSAPRQPVSLAFIQHCQLDTNTLCHLDATHCLLLRPLNVRVALLIRVHLNIQASRIIAPSQSFKTIRQLFANYSAQWCLHSGQSCYSWSH